MLSPTPPPSNLNIREWIEKDRLYFSPDDPESFRTMIERIISTNGEVDLLGFGEALHGSEELLNFRNRIFQYLVRHHGYSAIAIESSFPRSRLVNEYIHRERYRTYEEIKTTGFSHGFGASHANRDLVEWMRDYNADPLHGIKLRFYGCDSPTEMTHTDSPRMLLTFVLDYLTSVDPEIGLSFKSRVEPLLMQDSLWENPDAMMDPTRPLGSSPKARSLRLETEELITELTMRRPELTEKSGFAKYQEALFYAGLARQLLTYHAGLAMDRKDRVSRLLGMRDAMIADILTFIVSAEKNRGKVFVHAHNSHLKYGVSKWQLGPHLLSWWSAGSHLKVLIGSKYQIIGTGVGRSESHGIGEPEQETLEHLLSNGRESSCIIPTYQGVWHHEKYTENMPIRSGSKINSTYFPFTHQSINEFDWLMFFDRLG